MDVGRWGHRPRGQLLLLFYRVVGENTNKGGKELIYNFYFYSNVLLVRTPTTAEKVRKKTNIWRINFIFLQKLILTTYCRDICDKIHLLYL